MKKQNLKPEFMGDVFRQDVYRTENAPDEPGVMVPLPTKELADAWNGK